MLGAGSDRGQPKLIEARVIAKKEGPAVGGPVYSSRRSAPPSLRIKSPIPPAGNAEAPAMLPRRKTVPDPLSVQCRCRFDPGCRRTDPIAQQRRLHRSEPS